MNTMITPATLFPIKVNHPTREVYMNCGDDITVYSYLDHGWSIEVNERSRKTFAPIIADHIYEAYRIWGDDDLMVATEILNRAADQKDSIVNEINLKTVEAILKEVGGTRIHQSIYQFTMNLITK